MAGTHDLADVPKTHALYTDPADPATLIADVVARPLTVNRDPRGILVETLKVTWSDCYDPERWPFAQTYYSVTEPWVARDEDRWHVHEHQADRFVVPSGDVVVALYDPRPASPTHRRVNLLRLGQSNGDAGQILVLIPPRVLHGFMVIGPGPALLLNYPTRLYDQADEGRVPIAESGARLADGRPFSWELVREVERAATAGRR
ncbi:MAG: dTDP-4-dehydrorhamnose 3,5-epimerase family protein [Chloroflexota bacterium]|nr:dTDP-4-dehydrorhamnose 3,5-epimerase family protein [Chloroflexota bacterium]